MDEEIPKRSDDIYKEIESFKDYEFTNCIAYEMAIRSNCFINNIIKEVQELNKKFLCNKINDNTLSFGYFEMYLSTILREFGISERKLYEVKKIKQLQEIEVVAFLLENYNREKQTLDNPFKTARDGYEIVQYGAIEEYENGTPFGYVISPDFSRPYFKHKESINAEIEINLSLPEDELIAYISKIKDEYDNDNSIIKSPLELLGEDFEKSNNKKINKKLIADKFFIYDYVASRLKQIKDDNLLRYEEYEEQKQEILNDKYIDSNDRKVQLKELKRELKENTNVRKNEVFEDIEGFSSGTAKRYYYDIKPFIDDCKYKELITGTTTK